ncbi:MAG: glycosyltransferase [Chloracidobacterium sp.]|nr:glycosyltransferase [Chloracidobacterium sp.]
MPMAMLEAMACRCVVIASDNASITAVIDNGENGFIVPSGDADACQDPFQGNCGA